jgi:hypothetical protein
MCAMIYIPFKPFVDCSVDKEIQRKEKSRDMADLRDNQGSSSYPSTTTV